MTRVRPVVHHLLDMESDVADVLRWGHALVAMGTSDTDIKAGAAYAVGIAVQDLGKRLDQRWTEALELAKCEGRSCA